MCGLMTTIYVTRKYRRCQGKVIKWMRGKEIGGRGEREKRSQNPHPFPKPERMRHPNSSPCFKGVPRVRLKPSSVELNSVSLHEFSNFVEADRIAIHDGFPSQELIHKKLIEVLPLTG